MPLPTPSLPEDNARHFDPAPRELVGTAFQFPWAVPASSPLAFYNEIDPLAAQTIREAMARGLIAPGIVDERDIRDIRPDELAGYTQVHLFAGGGIWSYALRRAGWPDDRPIWTCSCPCQPFSTAGKGNGFDDERHLWPAAYWLIAQCEPECIAGEQVADKGADPWLDLVQADLEAMDYAFGCVPLASAGVGAPNPRHRSFWLAYAAGIGRSGIRGCGQDRTAERGGAHGLGNPLRDGAEPVGGNCDCPQGAADGIDRHIPWSSFAPGHASPTGGLADASLLRHERSGAARRRGHGPADDGDTLRLADAMRAGRPERGSIAGDGQATGSGGASDRDPGPTNGFWRNADWLLCRDPRGPRWRPVDAGTFPLAPGHPARVGGLRISGNAINAEVATAFIEAALDVIDGAVPPFIPDDAELSSDLPEYAGAGLPNADLLARSVDPFIHEPEIARV